MQILFKEYRVDINSGMFKNRVLRNPKHSPVVIRRICILININIFTILFKYSEDFYN